MTFHIEENIKLVSKITISSHLSTYTKNLLHSAKVAPHLPVTYSQLNLHCIYTPSKHLGHLDRYHLILE